MFLRQLLIRILFRTVAMKTTCVLVLAISSYAIVLKAGENAEYEGKVSVPITEYAAYSLCKELNLHLDSFLEFSEKFYNVPLLQTTEDTTIWFKNGRRMTAIKTLSYLAGCYQWEMRPCYGWYPNSFNHPCTFWIPKEYPGGKCRFDFDEKDANKLLAQKPVSINGRSAAQLCNSVKQAMDLKRFSMSYIPLKMNLRSTNRCDTWNYTSDGDDTGKWEVEEMRDEECDEKYPDFEIEELEDPDLGGARCFPSLSGEYECFFDDNNIPIQVLLDIQNKPTAIT